MTPVERARALSAELARSSIATLQALAAAHRTMPLEEFSPIVRAELVLIIAARFPSTPRADIRTILEGTIVISANRMSLDFDSIAVALLGLSET